MTNDTDETTRTTATDDESRASGSPAPERRIDTPTDTNNASRDASDRQTVLEATDLTFSYGDVDVLRGVALTVATGDVTALIGPNGTGKTTLLRAVAGFEAPTGGVVHYRGSDVPREIGYLPQQPAFRPGFTVAETIEFYASLVGETRVEAVDRLELVGLADAASRRVDALSGGMTRLLGIAQATIGDPPVVILDEPASGLDPGMSTRVFEGVREIADDDTAVLLTSHDMGLVERTADEVYLLDDGVVAESGHPAAIVDHLGVESLRAAYEASVSGDLYSVQVQGESA